MAHQHRCRHNHKCKPFAKYGLSWADTIDCAKQAAWNIKMTKLLTKEPKSMRGFSFMPKGEVT